MDHYDGGDGESPLQSVVCYQCSTHLQYPAGAMFIQCPKCGATQSPAPAPPVMSYVHCIGCNALLSHPASTPTIQCPKCLIIMDLPDSRSAGASAAAAGNRLKKKRKDPNAPKRASNAYMVFCKEQRPKIKEQRPELTFGKIGAMLGEMWRSMSPEERKPYEDRSLNDRDRYKKEITEYQSTAMIKHQQQQSSQNTTNNNNNNLNIHQQQIPPPIPTSSSSGSSSSSSSMIDHSHQQHLQQQQQQQQFSQQHHQQHHVGVDVDDLTSGEESNKRLKTDSDTSASNAAPPIVQ